MDLLDKKNLLVGIYEYKKFIKSFEKFFVQFCEDISDSIACMASDYKHSYVSWNTSNFVELIIREYESLEPIENLRSKIDVIRYYGVSNNQYRMTPRQFLLSKNVEELKALGLTFENLKNLENIVNSGHSLEERKSMFRNVIKMYLENTKVKNKKEYVESKVKYKEVMETALLSGRKFRPMLVFLGNLLTKKEVGKEVLIAASVIELMHKYSLIIDDLYDDDDYRRGLPTFHKKYGKEETEMIINFIRTLYDYNLMNFSAYWKDTALSQYNIVCLDIGRSFFQAKPISDEVSNVWKNAHEGFYDEIAAREEGRNLTAEEVIEIERKQTSYIIKNSLIIGYNIGANKNLDETIKNQLDILGDKLGIIFQIINDLEIFLSDEYQNGNKGKLYSDLKSGAKNFVASLIPNDFAGTLSIEEKVDYIKRENLVEQAVQYLQNEFDLCLKLIKKLPRSETRSLLMFYTEKEKKELIEKLNQNWYQRSDKIFN